jgi:predicted NUDIX family NTP pyrophosphohydrolase
MSSDRSAAIALVRRGPSGQPEVLMVHFGGPFWAKKDAGAWGLPKGLIEPGEDPLVAARREFHEETGSPAPEGPATPLGEVTQKSGKRIVAFGLVGDFDVTRLASNVIEIEYPARSGKRIKIPEIDRAEWATLERARVALNPAQVPLVEKALSLV